MRASARAIILQNNKILLIHRIKNDNEYYVIPGGGIEPNETPESTIIREIKEELSLDVTIDRKIGDFMNNGNPLICFLITSFSGEISVGGPEKEIMQEDQTNKYIPEWIDVHDIDSINLVPEFIRVIIHEVSSKIV